MIKLSKKNITEFAFSPIELDTAQSKLFTEYYLNPANIAASCQTPYFVEPDQGLNCL